jgi:hypothetical protein
VLSSGAARNADRSDEGAACRVTVLLPCDMMYELLDAGKSVHSSEPTAPLIAPCSCEADKDSVESANKFIWP